MSRSLKKGFYAEEKLLAKVQKARANNSLAMIKTHSRASTITPEMEGLTIGVHNGRQYVPVSITTEHLMHKLGEFSPTRAFGNHAGDKNVKGK